MLLLSVDSSSQAATAALLSDGELLCEYTQNQAKTHSVKMLPMIEQMMAILPSLAVYMIYVLFLLVVVITGVILFALKRRQFVCNPGELELSKKEKRKLVLGNVGMILYIVYWIVMMVIQFMQ